MRILEIVFLCAVLGVATAQLSAQQPDPCQHKHRIVGDITYCDRYWECIGGQPQLYDCPNGLVFVGRNRGIAESCDYPWRGAYCDNKQQANPPISTEHCDWLYGIFGHETSCTRYWTCWNGTATEQFCIGGLLYNEETHACDWPQNVAGCQKHPLCKDDPNANVPLGKSCERYWACQGGYPRLQRCPATLVFDKQSRRCVSPPTVDCDVPSTTPPPPEEEQKQPFRSSNPARGGGNAAQVRRPQQQQQQQQRRPPPQNVIQSDSRPNFRVPEGALPIQSNNNLDIDPSSDFRPPVIPGAILLNN